MRVLIACECSGIVRAAFRLHGHDAYSCDLKPSETDSPKHIIGDAIQVAHNGRWDLVIAHPPCTYLCSSGLHWNYRRPERKKQTEHAAAFFLAFTQLRCKWAIENPVGCMSRLYRKPNQIIQPYEYGEDASKKTCLWLSGLPLLRPTCYYPPRMVSGRPRWGNQTDSGQAGIAMAMADQWGNI